MSRVSTLVAVIAAALLWSASADATVTYNLVCLVPVNDEPAEQICLFPRMITADIGIEEYSLSNCITQPFEVLCENCPIEGTDEWGMTSTDLNPLTGAPGLRLQMESMGDGVEIVVDATGVQVDDEIELVRLATIALVAAVRTIERRNNDTALRIAVHLPEGVSGPVGMPTVLTAMDEALIDELQNELFGSGCPATP